MLLRKDFWPGSSLVGLNTHTHSDKSSNEYSSALFFRKIPLKLGHLEHFRSAFEAVEFRMKQVGYFVCIDKGMVWYAAILGGCQTLTACHLSKSRRATHRQTFDQSSTENFSSLFFPGIYNSWSTFGSFCGNWGSNETGWICLRVLIKGDCDTSTFRRMFNSYSFWFIENTWANLFSFL